jgi:leukotriene-A4 hydrolase
MDIHSHAQPDLVRVTHASLELELDFERHEARGRVRLDLERHDPSAPLLLDAQALAIESAAGGDGGAREFRLAPPEAGLGSALTVQLAPADRSVTLRYHTTAGAEALQWLAPEQTHDKHAPFLFTQGQAILTRSWIPLQDSPSVRITYDAAIRCPEGLRPVMSAEQLGRGPDGAWRFRMPQPIPSYLIALGCGDLAFLPISERCGIWAEPGQVEAARSEFEDTEKMVQAAEKLFGPYRWGRYDLLVLPPSFPFGGMENPCLTFVTPTVIAGDRSLVSLIAHELAHSWSGNLVTNATWSDFWLNEGFTNYFEGRIMERIYGTDRARMEEQVDLAELEREMKDLPPRDQILQIDLKGRHPDDGVTDVPYVKGALFLSRLEELFGRGRFDRFLRSYFDSHAFRSMGTEQFVTYLRKVLFAQDPDLARRIDLAKWLGQPGIPEDAPRAQSKSLADVDRQIERFQQGAAPAELETRGWVTHQWLHFLEGIAGKLDAGAMAKLDAEFHFTATGNCEVLDTWLRLAIANGYAPADARIEEFLLTVGRRKYLEPLYKELAKTESGLARAKAIYSRARPRYHALSATTIDAVLGEKKAG